jgi:hypothetical protein
MGFRREKKDFVVQFAPELFSSRCPFEPLNSACNGFREKEERTSERIYGRERRETEED